MYNDYFGFRVEPFSLTPDPDFYYTNSVYEEAFAALQYGVTAKKGFIVITGEVGTGKTILLQKLLRNPGPMVHSVFIFNTQISFDELLRFILSDLGLASKTDARSVMIETINQYLIERLKEGHTVCLLVDEAQDLSDESLEGLKLLSNLETDKEKLLQIVLMGQPKLEERLQQPGLRQLKQRVALHCQLAHLKRAEVGRYIDFRIKAAGYQNKSLFTSNAVERIALYSGGIPRLINIICDNALLTAYAESEREVSEEMIREIAMDLRLSERPGVQTPPMEAPISREPGESSDAQVKREPDGVWESRLGLNDFPAGLDYARREERKKSWIGLRLGALLALVLVGGGGAFGYSDRARSYLADLRSNLKEFIENRSAGNAALPQPQRSHDSSTGVATAQSELTEGDYAKNRPAGDNSDLLQELVSTKNVTAGEPGEPGKTTTVPKERPRVRTSNNPDLRKKAMELEIDKAIQNRAITGVTVSLIDGTTYLDGEVATERQKSMAERAARSVADVKDVKNRLTVKAF